MKIEEANYKVIVSDWKQKVSIATVLILIVFSIFLIFVFGLMPGIIASIFLSLALTIGLIIDGLSNFSRVQFDFKNNEIDSTSRFLGMIIRRNKIQNADFNMLEFNEYRRKGGGFKKYVLEYNDGASKMMVYRVNQAEERDEILNKIRTNLKTFVRSSA